MNRWSAPVRQITGSICHWRSRADSCEQRSSIPGAKLADDVVVGPFCVIGEHVTIGKGTKLLSHVTVDGWTEIGERNELHPFRLDRRPAPTS